MIYITTNVINSIKLIKKLIFSFSLLISIASFAQEGTASPYSFYGIGDVRFKGAVDSRSMAGISVFPDSIHLNLQNPAQLASLKMMTFGVGGTYTQSTLKTTTQKSKTKRTTFDYLTVGLPLGKLGVSFGVAPYSSVGYKIQNVITGNNAQVSRYSGLGGVNRTFVGLGFYIAKNFSIGADLQYNFGKIETTSITYLEGIQNGSREINTSNVTGVTFNTGFAYQAKVAKKLFLFTSGTFSPKSNLNLSNTRIIDIPKAFKHKTSNQRSKKLKKDTSLNSINYFRKRNTWGKEKWKYRLDQYKRRGE
jgi:hypothetical protein